MYQHNWAETADLATSAQQFANWMESVISEAFQDNQNLGANWQSNAASQYIGTTLKQAMNRCENTKAAMVTYLSHAF